MKECYMYMHVWRCPLLCTVHGIYFYFLPYLCLHNLWDSAHLMWPCCVYNWHVWCSIMATFEIVLMVLILFVYMWSPDKSHTHQVQTWYEFMIAVGGRRFSGWRGQMSCHSFVQHFPSIIAAISSVECLHLTSILFTTLGSTAVDVAE